MRKEAWLTMAAVCSAVLLLGCVSTESGDAASEAQVIKQDIEDRADMVNRADVEGLINAWDENGIRMAPNKSPITGIEALAKATRAQFDRMEFKNRVHDVQEVQVFGDWAFSWGYYSDERTPKAGGPTTRYYGKYLVVLKKHPDGSWKKYNDCTNDEPPPK